MMIALALLSTACWDTKDISDRLFISAIGIDEAAGVTPAQGKKPLKYKVTAEIIHPFLLKEAPSRISDGQTGSIILTAEGETLQNALDLIQANVARRLTLSDLQVIIVSDEMGDNFKDISSYFEKHPEVARRIRLAFIKNGTAQDALKIKPKTERYIAEELIGMIEISKELTLGLFKPFTKLLSELRINNGHSLGASFFISDNNLVRYGSVVFEDWKLVGWLDKEETVNANILFPDIEKFTFIGSLDGGVFTYKVDNKKVKIRPIISNNQVNFTISLKVDGIILQEENGGIDLSQPGNIKILEGLFKDIITKTIEAALNTSQNVYGVDYFMFGMELMNRYPDFYNSLNWKEVYPTVKIKPEVQVKISRFGIAK